jgi:flagellar biosynthesis/type III secretory pathway protein FliH
LKPELAYWLSFFALANKSEVEMLKIKEKYPIVKEAFDDPLVKRANKEFKRFKSNRKMQEIERRHHLFMVGYHEDLTASKVEGKTEGIAEGIAEGKAEGKAEGITEGILRVLSKKFGQVPQSIADALDKRTDNAVLMSLLVSASECTSLDEFVAGL